MAGGTASDQKDITDYVRSSVYVAMRDGTAIAVDIFRPATSSATSEAPLPLIWTATPYRRAYYQDGQLVHFLTRYSYLREVVTAGYVIALADVRGAGASFGSYETTYAAQEIEDAADLMDWFAQQCWCDGNIGMFGASYLGQAQYQAALSGSPHLKALFPCVNSFDRVPVIWPGGIYVKGFFEDWYAMKQGYDLCEDTVPVDADVDSSLLRAAQQQHLQNRYGMGNDRSPFREDFDWCSLDGVPHPGHAPTPQGAIGRLNEAGVPVYNLGGWFDITARDTLLLHMNLSTPRKLLMGAWHHWQLPTVDLASELVRWFDYWLKGAANGVMDEPAVRYAVIDRNGGLYWKESETWPDAAVAMQPMYLGEKRLTSDAPDRAISICKAISHASLGENSRWRAPPGQIPTLAPFRQDIMAQIDAVGVCFTSEIYRHDIEVVGSAVAHLYLSSNGGNFDCIAYLAEVDANQVSRYLGEGMLRASHRETNDPPYETGGLPYRRQSRADLRDVAPGDIAEYIFDFTPIGWRIRAGGRLRLVLVASDRVIYDTLDYAPCSTLTVHSSPERPSWIALPVCHPAS